MICLLPSCAYLSETSRMLEIHSALSRLGVPVRVATHGGTHEPLLAAAGVEYDVIGPPMDAERSARLVREAIGAGPVGQSMYADDELLAYVRAEAAYFREHDVRVAVTGFTLTALLSTRLAGIPLVTEYAGSFVPPVFERGLLPGGLRGRVAGALLPRLRHYCSGFNRVAAELGVEPVPSLPALLLGDLTLVPEVPEVLGISRADLEAWRPRGRGYRAGTRLRYSGPLFAHLEVPVPDRAAEFLAGPGPVVYVALTSTRAALVRETVAAAAATGARVLVAGTVHDVADLESDRVLVAGVLPSHEVMPQVDLAVVTGGQGSVQTAMAAGTPVLGVPLQLEQQLNLALLSRLGAARAVPPSRVGRRLTRLADAMLTDDRYRGAARDIKQLYDAVDGPTLAAEAIAELAHEAQTTQEA
ncbi:glycosyltransferase [Nocardioides speluncae]|uniref:glycosyltransferase n=1 Tax=Nocardioides speluncae TaxID=2670337 RepID=UPI001379FF31|nr:hypothetical protein [Nocardioides speluncae]